jgi:hypothetical protein
MRIQGWLLAGLVAVGAGGAQGAQKDFEVKWRNAITQDGRFFRETARQSYGFRVEVISDQEGVKPEASKGGRPYVTAQKNERYSVRLYNPLPVRVAVNLTVDGLNSITGKPAGVADGSKWVIEPYSTVTIPGWQVNDGDSRRFFFTDKPASYAKWRGDNLNKDLERNCGVIGAAFFWSQTELDRYYEERPLCRDTYRPAPFQFYGSEGNDQSLGKASAPAAASEQGARASRKEARRDRNEEEAGTGMGERQSHPTMTVNFQYDRGMYKPSQALVIYYGFEERTYPNPFPGMDYAPEM